MLTDWRYAFTRALSVLPVCCLQHIFRWRFCQDRAQSHVVVSGKSFFWQNKKHVALGVKEDLEAERNAVAIRTKHNHTILREKRLN